MFGVVLDSGVIVRTFYNKRQARAWMRKHNAMAREQKERGDLVSLRYAVGIVRPKMAQKIESQQIASLD